jgi:hypothetical protein
MKFVQKDSLVFPVHKVDFEPTFGMAANQDYACAIIGEINGVETVMNVCSDRYELVPVADIYSQVETILAQHKVNYTTNVQMANDNAQFFIDYIIEDEKYAIQIKGTKDFCKPMVRVYHSYNGKVKATFTLGYYRLVCSNGLVIPVEGKEQKNMHISCRHTQSILSKLKEFTLKLEYLLNSAELAKAGYERLSDTKVEAYGERIEEVLNAIKLPVDESRGRSKDSDADANYSPYFAKAFTKIREEMNTLNIKEANDWLVYNAVNFAIFDNEVNIKSNDVRTNYDSSVMSYLLNPENTPELS